MPVQALGGTGSELVMDLVHRFRGPPTTLPSEAGTARALGLPSFVLFCFLPLSPGRAGASRAGPGGRGRDGERSE